MDCHNILLLRKGVSAQFQKTQDRDQFNRACQCYLYHLERQMSLPEQILHKSDKIKLHRTSLK